MITDTEIIKDLCHSDELSDIPIMYIIRIADATLDYLSPDGIIVAFDKGEVYGRLS